MARSNRDRLISSFQARTTKRKPPRYQGGEVTPIPGLGGYQQGRVQEANQAYVPPNEGARSPGTGAQRAPYRGRRDRVQPRFRGGRRYDRRFFNSPHRPQLS